MSWGESFPVTDQTPCRWCVGLALAGCPACDGTGEVPYDWNETYLLEDC